jgi:hypothetical protein
MLPKCENLIPMINQLIEDVHNGSNYTTITTAGAGYKDVVGYSGFIRTNRVLTCSAQSVFLCVCVGGWGDHCQSS